MRVWSRIAAALLALAYLCAPPADAFVRRAAPTRIVAAASQPAPTCAVYPTYTTPSTTAPYDGCPDASLAISGLATQFYDPTAFSDGTLFQNGQCSGPRASSTCAGVRAINWNVAGVDFPIGIRPVAAGQYCDGPYVSLDNPKRPCSATPGATNLIDASTYDWAKDDQAGYANTGCVNGGGTSSWVHLTTGSAGRTDMKCVVKSTTGQTINILGFDWTPNEGCTAVGIGCPAVQACVGFEIVTSAGVNKGTGSGGVVNFMDNRYKNIYPQTSTAGVNIFTPTSCMQTTSKTGVFEGIFFGASAGPIAAPTQAFTDNWTVNFEYNYIDGNALQAYTLYGYRLPGTIGGGSVTYYEIDAGYGAAHVKYNAFKNSVLQYMYPQGNCGGFDVVGNVVLNQTLWRGSAQHGDFGLPSPGICLWGTTITPTFTAGSPNMVWGGSGSLIPAPAINTAVTFVCAQPAGCTMPTGITTGATYYILTATGSSFTIGTVTGSGQVTPGTIGSGQIRISSGPPTMAYQNWENNLFYSDSNVPDGPNNTAMFNGGNIVGTRGIPFVITNLVTALNVFEANKMDHWSTGQNTGGAPVAETGTASVGDQWALTQYGPTNPALNYGVVGNGNCAVAPTFQVTAVSGGNISGYTTARGGNCKSNLLAITSTATCYDNIVAGSPNWWPFIDAGSCGAGQTATFSIPAIWSNAQFSVPWVATSGTDSSCGAGNVCSTTVTNMVLQNNMTDKGGFTSTVAAGLEISNTSCTNRVYGAGTNFDIVGGVAIPLHYAGTTTGC